MEEKKSNLFLVKSHHSFDDEGTEFKTEMLAWPIYQSEDDEKIIEEKYQKVIKDALFAMTQLSPFSAKISLGVDEKNQRLFDIHRIWGRIYLEEKVVLYFSHDTRNSDAAFVSLFEWVEMMNFASYPEYEGHHDEFQKVVDWSSRKNWKEFFLERIENKTSQLTKDAIPLIEQLTETMKDLMSISNALKEVSIETTKTTEKKE